MKRTGFTLFEVCIAMALVSVAVGLTFGFVAELANGRLEWERRQLALREVANLMERVMAQAAGQLPASDARPELSAEARGYLPGARLEIEMASPDALGLKRVSIVLHWNQRNGLPAAPVRLVTLVGGTER